MGADRFKEKLSMNTHLSIFSFNGTGLAINSVLLKENTDENIIKDEKKHFIIHAFSASRLASIDGAKY